MVAGYAYFVCGDVCVSVYAYFIVGVHACRWKGCVLLVVVLGFVLFFWVLFLLFLGVVICVCLYLCLGVFVVKGVTTATLIRL